MSDMIDQRPMSSIPLPTGPGIRDIELEIEYDTDSAGEETGKSQTGEMPRQGFFGLLRTVILTNYKALPRRLLKDAIWLGPLALLWVGLWSIGGMTLMTLPGPIRSLAWILIFLTATYNGFIGKAAFITVLSRTFIPMIRRIRAGELPEIRERYARTARMLRTAAAAAKRQSLKICLAGAGLGLIASNILTRNNKIDKYFICILCAVALFDDLSKGKGSVVVRLAAAGLRDLPLLAGQRFNVTMRTTCLSIGAFGFGLVLAIVPGQFVNSFTSPAGAIAGALLIVAALVLQLTEGAHAKRR